MDEELELRPDEAPHDAIEEDGVRYCVRAEFWSLIMFCATSGNLPDDGIFDSNGSALLIRGEY